MDWKYKHFNHEATFKAAPTSVGEAAHTVVAGSLNQIEDTSDGFIGRGYGAWHAEIATFRITAAPDGTKVTVELLVERASTMGYMLVDIGGYYDGQIDKWFSGISRQLADTHEQVLVNKTTSNSKIRQGCLAGCLVFLLVGSCLGILAIPLDNALFPKISGSSQGLFSFVASVIGLLAGVIAYIYVTVPEAATSRFIRALVQRTRNNTRR